MTDSIGTQSVYVAPEAYKVASAEFGEDIQFWEDALLGQLAGKLSSVCISLCGNIELLQTCLSQLSGAKVLLINEEDPFVAVNANALVAGGYQSFSTRQNS